MGLPALDPKAKAYDYDGIPCGYYDEVMRRGHPVRRCWHRQKFERVIAALPPGEGLSILDIGCAAGTFLSMVPRARFARQLGVDIIAKQVEWATGRYGTKWRQFRRIDGLEQLATLGERFDCITLIEVIEHLDAAQIRELLARVADLLRPGGSFLLTTPNYASAWPILERVLNRVSDVTYDEQHLTRFTYAGFERHLRRIAPGFDRRMALDLKTTSHFMSPFLGLFSERLAMGAARLRNPGRWRFPFGNLILARFRSRDDLPSTALTRPHLRVVGRWPARRGRQADPGAAPSAER
jgi:2-polyprenyl-3-methyl-5-hydroxy-6-metoxy-1,4-benzoquinol methylase